MLDKLPQDILLDILVKLPIETILSSAYVSKSWRSTLTTPDLNTAFIERKNKTHLFFSYYRSEGDAHYFSSERDDDSFRGEFQEQKMPIKGVGNSINIVGSSNGVICLSDDLHGITNNIILWNPSVRKSLTLPKPPISFNSHGGYDMAVGFGFERATNDYKVVRLVYLQSAAVAEWQSLAPPEVEVYSLSSRSWRTLDRVSASLYRVKGEYYSQCCIDGVVHWPGWVTKLEPGCTEYAIVAFDLKDEVFKEIDVPQCLARRLDQNNQNRGPRTKSSMYLEVGEYKGMLALIKMGGDDKLFSIWVMTEYGVETSWSEVFRFDPDSKKIKHSRIGHHIVYKPIKFGFRKTGEIMMFVALSSQYSEYEDEEGLIKLVYPKGNESKNLKSDVYATPYSMRFGSYVESLALIKEGDRTTLKMVSVKFEKKNEDKRRL